MKEISKKYIRLCQGVSDWSIRVSLGEFQNIYGGKPSHVA